ncbi:MAG: metallophosphoesterase [Thermoplasmata archaeon]
MRDHLVTYFETHHKLVEADALALLLETTQPLAVCRRILRRADDDSPFITRTMVEGAIAQLALERGGTAVALRPGDPLPEIRPPPPPYELVREGYSAAPPGRAPLEAYSALFHSRFETLARLLRGRPGLPNLRPVAELRGQEGSASMIGMVREVRQTQEKHHIILTLEDASGALEALVVKDSPPAKVPYLPDEVLGVHLAVPKERGRIPRVVGVERPELPAGRPVHRAGRPSRVIFLSDLHIGSRSFMEDAWGQLVDFLHERDAHAEIAHGIDHVVVAGDLVDGIGIYPNQEKDLAITDVFEQYHELGRRLRELPERLNVVVVPGNHDAVGPAEPQPGLPPEIRASLPPNVRSIGNPSTFALEGVVVEAYHGRSFDDLIPAIPGASYARPTEVMKRMLAMRHLGPIYGGRTPLAPLPRDGLVIDPAPDILVTGHAHTFGVDQYRGVLLLNASTWQAETEYQRMRNITPIPARAAVVNLADFTLEALDFSIPRPTARAVPA